MRMSSNRSWVEIERCVGGCRSVEKRRLEMPLARSESCLRRG